MNEHASVVVEWKKKACNLATNIEMVVTKTPLIAWHYYILDGAFYGKCKK
jgi:hypothetical protein